MVVPIFVPAPFSIWLFSKKFTAQLRSPVLPFAYAGGLWVTGTLGDVVAAVMLDQARKVHKENERRGEEKDGDEQPVCGTFCRETSLHCCGAAASYHDIAPC